MTSLICGSFAYDTIMKIPDEFKNCLLPSKIHMLNVSFLASKLRHEFGGCAGNIAYNLKLLGDEPMAMGTVGSDFSKYATWMDKCAINRHHVHIKDDNYTAQAFVTTDKYDNQITIFYPGAMNQANETHINETKNISLAIVAPDDRDGMIQHAQQLYEARIPFIFDPGQGLTMFNANNLLTFTEQATYITLNNYEAQFFQDTTGISLYEIAEHVEALIITRGCKGSHIYTKKKYIEIPCAKAKGLADPTGCGDAYRAGLMYGIMHREDWETTGRIASLLGAIKIEQYGTQNHEFTMEEFHIKFEHNFNFKL